MAATERVNMNSLPRVNLLQEGVDTFISHLKIGARTTTASLSDYPEWSMEELYGHRRDGIVTDGACS